MQPIPTAKKEQSTLLELHHEDYFLYIVAPTQAAMQIKAESILDKEALQTEYRWSEGARLFLKDEQTEQQEDGTSVEENVICSKVSTALFFENTDYQVVVVFNSPKDIKHVTLLNPIFLDEMGKRENRASYMAQRGVLSFNLNYGNDIGQSDIKVEYTIGEETRHLWLHFDVMSTKLDYHKDLRCILEDIEREYTMLSLSFLRKTYHTYSIDANTKETPDLIWWNLFKDVQDEFCRAVSKVIDSPHNRLRVQNTFRRADQLRHVSPMLENEWHKYKKEEKHLYRTEEWVLNDDTAENRFVKFALNNIKEKYQQLRTQIEKKNSNLPESYRKEMMAVEDTLNRLSTAPFLRRIGRFTGLKGENLTLKQATGYSTIYRDWLLLQSTYNLHDGIQRMELKDIAELYEIWCFIEVKNIVRQLIAAQKNIPIEEVGQYTSDDSSVDRSLTHDFVVNLNRGEKSKVILKHDDIALAEVVYNAQFSDSARTNANSGLGENVGALTAEQRPDIVLRLTKADVEKGIELTYLFDAKYRLEINKNDDEEPPDDTINQMHRYRDAIYYSNVAYRKNNIENDLQLKREVIGGYILFPGNNKKEDFEKSKFYKSIEKVNIGAFPLRPDVNGTKDSLLRDFLNGIISKPRRNTLMESIPQRGLNYTDEPVVESGYFLSIIDPKVNDKVKELEEGTAKEFVSGYAAPTSGINFQCVKYFAPMVNHIVRGVYKVNGVTIIDTSDKLNDKRELNKGKGKGKGKDYNKPYRIQLKLGNYEPVREFTYGVKRVYSCYMNRKEFQEYLDGKHERKEVLQKN